MSPSPGVRAAFFAFLTTAATWPYLSTAGAQNDFRDAQVLSHYESTARRTVLDYAELPLWNPYSCGGLFALGSPQTRFAAPTFLASLLFGTSRGEAVVHWLLVLIALEGAYRCLRSHRSSRIAALLAAPVFGLFGIFACAPFLGWVSFCGFALLPWAVWGTQQALRGRRFGVPLVAACIAFLAGFGGTYTVPITALACASEFVGPLVRRRFKLVLTVSASLLLSTLGLAAFRLLPIWETLRHAPRVVASLESHSLLEIAGLVFGVGAPYVAPECWYLIGLPAALLALFELRHRRSGWLFASLACCVWVAMGRAATPSLFDGLRQLPLFDMLRSPERFLVVAALIVSQGAGRALTSMQARARSNPRWVWGVRVATLALLLNSSFQISNFFAAARMRTLVPTPPEIAQPFHQARGNRWAVTEFGAMNRGSLSCWEAYPVPQSRLLRADLTDEAVLEDPTSGQVEQTDWSPNRMHFRLSLRRASRLVVNQNHHPGWRASGGTVTNHEGLLAVEVPPGETEVRLTFRPRSAVVGFTVSLLTGLALFITYRRGPRARLVLLAAALIIGAVQFTLVHESWPPRVARDVEGQPVVVDAPDPKLPFFNVDFEGGVRLQAASATRLQGHRVRLELDWQVPTRASPTLGIFVHLEPAGGTWFQADHPLISNALRFTELPVGKTGRDVLLITVPPAARDKPLTVWVGLWALHGDGARQRVLTQTSMPVNADRLQVATLPPPTSD